MLSAKLDDLSFIPTGWKERSDFHKVSFVLQIGAVGPCVNL